MSREMVTSLSFTHHSFNFHSSLLTLITCFLPHFQQHIRQVIHHVEQRPAGFIKLIGGG